MTEHSHPSEFVKYIGGPALHDSTILSYIHNGANLDVLLRAEDGHRFGVSFSGVHKVDLNRPEEMLVYALAELTGSSFSTLRIRQLGRER
jgi:hypothetical protein